MIDKQESRYTFQESPFCSARLSSPCSLSVWFSFIFPFSLHTVSFMQIGTVWPCLGLVERKATSKAPSFCCWGRNHIGAADHSGSLFIWRGGRPTNIPTSSRGPAELNQLQVIVWMDTILHHLATMVETIFCWYLQGNHHVRVS